VAVLGAGISGFYVLGRLAGGEPTILNCAYQTVITLSTLGSREMMPLSSMWYGQLFILVLIFSGMGLLFVFATSLTAFFVEGEVQNIFRRKKMDKALKHLKDHIIVCGAGDTGSYVIEELLRSKYSVVIVDASEEHINRIVQQHPKSFIPFVIGEAADDESLEKAGIDRASGVVAALPDERDNLFITVTARQTNPDVRIVARASDEQAEIRLKRSGADGLVSPNRIGGMRLASEMIRPQVVGFLDKMLKGQERTLRIEEIPLTHKCSMVGKALKETRLRSESDLLVLAIKDTKKDRFHYNPSPETILKDESTLIVLGPVESVHKIRNQMI
jgi:voltage-gated potassium channel